MKLLPNIFKNCFQPGTFPSTCKKSNILPVYKKRGKRIVQNYRLVSLLPILGKIFERIVFNKIFEFLNRNKLFTPDQFGFRRSVSCHNLLSVSCQNQFVSIFNKIYSLARNERGRGRRGLACPFSKIEKKCPNLEKKCPDCVHLWAKFFI